MTDWTTTLSHTEKAKLALEVGVVALNAKQLGQQLERILTKVPPAETSTVLELTAAAHLIHTIERSLDAKANHLADVLDAEELHPLADWTAGGQS